MVRADCQCAQLQKVVTGQQVEIKQAGLAGGIYAQILAGTLPAAVIAWVFITLTGTLIVQPAILAGGQ